MAPDCDSRVEDRNCNTAGSSLSECSSSLPQSSSSAGDETLDSNTPHALVPSYRNCVKNTKRKKSPLILKRPSRWQERSTGLLFRKAGAVYHSLACMFNSKGKFGRGLRNCKLAFKCLEASRAFNAQSDIKQGNIFVLNTYSGFRGVQKTNTKVIAPIDRKAKRAPSNVNISEFFETTVTCLKRGKFPAHKVLLVLHFIGSKTGARFLS